jgi:hypothetical protein
VPLLLPPSDAKLGTWEGAYHHHRFLYNKAGQVVRPRKNINLGANKYPEVGREGASPEGFAVLCEVCFLRAFLPSFAGLSSLHLPSPHNPPFSPTPVPTTPQMLFALGLADLVLADEIASLPDDKKPNKDGTLTEFLLNMSGVFGWG